MEKEALWGAYWTVIIWHSVTASKIQDRIDHLAGNMGYMLKHLLGRSIFPLWQIKKSYFCAVLVSFLSPVWFHFTVHGVVSGWPIGPASFSYSCCQSHSLTTQCAPLLVCCFFCMKLISITWVCPFWWRMQNCYWKGTHLFRFVSFVFYLKGRFLSLYLSSLAS